MRIVLEGLTGAGKSQTIAAMERQRILPPVVVREEESFGDVMDEMDDPSNAPSFLLRRLAATLEELAALPQSASFLVERFHLSYYALRPEWALYADVDARLAAMGARLVLLTVPDAALGARSLRREEHGGSDWQDFAARYGSEDAAIAALRASQERRREALGLTRMEHVVVDTADKDWDAIARKSAAWDAAT